MSDKPDANEPHNDGPQRVRVSISKLFGTRLSGTDAPRIGSPEWDRLLDEIGQEMREKAERSRRARGVSEDVVDTERECKQC